MMFVHLAVMLTVTQGALLVPVHGQSPHEPTCISRYDYEHKVLHSIVKMEIEQESIREELGNVKRQADSERTKHKEEISELQKAVETKNAEIKQLEKQIEDLAEKSSTGCSQQCQDDRAAAGYTYKDELAQATCVALSVYHVFAVRRQCSGSAPNCASICKSLGLTCVNSLHVYNRPTVKLSDVAKLGLKMYRYNHCGGGCGPNFCCCQGP